MSIDKFGKTLLLLVFIVIFVAGARMAMRVGAPYVRKFSDAAADVMEAVSM